MCIHTPAAGEFKTHIDYSIFRLSSSKPASQQRDILSDASRYGHQAAFDFALAMRPISIPKTDAERRGHFDALMLEDAIRTTQFPPKLRASCCHTRPRSRGFQFLFIGCPTGWLRRSAPLAKVERVRYFLDNGAEPDFARRIPIDNPLDLAIRTNNETIIRMLLEAGADPNQRPPPYSYLVYAVW